MSDDKKIELTDELRRIIENYDLTEYRRSAGPLEREAWMGAARLIFDPGEREPCWVCGKFKGIAQAHHVIPLSQQYDRGFRVPDNEHVWLCPNHHTMAHLFILQENPSTKIAAARARGRTLSALMPDLSEDELRKMFDLMRRAARSPE